MDDGVGLVLDKIKALGLEKDTLVLFTSDNGGLPQSSQAPLRGFKGLYYEGGIRVPMIARWPGVTEPGSTCDVPVINVDFYPTFLDAAGASVPSGKALDGESLVPLFKGGKQLARPAIFWHFPGYLDRPNSGSRDQLFRTRPVTVIHKGDWKLHLFHEEWALDGGRDGIDKNNAVELYNLAGDIGEGRNVALERKEKRDELLGDVLTWFERVEAKLPTEANAKYAPSADPSGNAGKKKRRARRKK
jgi:arylsulfatase A-like enzyme